MLRRVLKRVASLILIAMMVISLIPMQSLEVYAAELSTSIPNISASYDAGTWSVAGNTISGSVTGTAAGSCNDATSQTGTLTLVNASGSTAVISFDISSVKIGSGGYARVNGESRTVAGSFMKELAADESVTVSLLSGSAGAYTTSIQLDNVTVTVKRNVTTTFAMAQGDGTYTVNGTTIATQTSLTQLSTTAYKLEAQPANGYKLAGWYSATQNKLISTSTKYDAYLDSPQTIYPIFVLKDTAIWDVGGIVFFDLNEAISYSSSNNISQITLIGDGKLPAGDYTIPAGKVLLVPYDVNNTVNTSTPSLYTSQSASAISSRTQYRTLTLANGANLIVRGSLCVNGKLNSFNYTETGLTSGPFGYINTETGSSITVMNGANLYSWGYISGNGEIIAKSGATIHEPFQIADLRGGSATSSMVGNAQKVMPFQQYYIQNIEAPLTIEYGANEIAFGTATIQGTTANPVMTFIGSSSGALFKLDSGTKFRKYYNPSTDRMTYEIYGDASLNSVTLNVVYTINLYDYVLPLMQNLTINIKSGTTTLNQDAQMIPGSEIVIDNGASLSVADNNSLYVYDRSEYVGKGYCISGADLRAMLYSPTRASKFSTSQMNDARVDVNGTLIADGSIYTTTSGANIMTSEGTGQVIFNNITSESTTYQAKQTGTSIEYDPITVTSAKLRNDNTKYPDGSEDAYTITESNTNAGDVYYYDSELGMWGNWESYNVTFVNGDESNAIKVRETGIVAEPETPVKDGYIFKGWYKDGAVYDFTSPVTSDFTLIAEWEEIVLSAPVYTWTSDNKTVTAVAECVADSAYSVTETVDSTVEETPATCDADGSYTYTATFENKLFKSQTKTVTTPKLGHKWGEPVWNWTEDKSSASATFICQNDATHTQSVSATISSEVVEASNCEQEGKIETLATASFNGKSYTNSVETIIAKTDHSWDNGKVTAEPNCTETGIKTYTCVNCGETRTETIEALGHNYMVDESTAHAASCTDEGKTADQKCTRCDSVISGKVLAKTGHSWDEGKVTTEPTCTEAGVKTYTCTNCGETRTETIEALGHNYVTDESTAHEASCTEAGKTANQKCTRCDSVISGEVIAKTGHSWDEGKITAEPTYTEDGIKTYTCIICGETRTEAIPKLIKQDEDDLLRIYGDNRYATAFKNADKLKELLGIEKFDTVVLTTGAKAPDALSGSYLASKNDAPLLLINEASASDVREYIMANTNPGATIIVLGGNSAVKDSWLTGFGSYNIERLDGASRYETNLKVLEKVGYSGGEILVATGANYADSLSGSSLDMPILLVKGQDSLTTEQKEFLAGKNPQIYIAGGASAVRSKLEAELSQYGRIVKRFAGKTRYETSKMIADTLFPNAEMAVLTVGNNFPDGLSVGTVANNLKAPILLTNNDKSDNAISYARAHNITNGIIIGGAGLISDATAEQIFGEKSIVIYEANKYTK